MRGTGGMSGMVGEGGHAEAAFGPMGSLPYGGFVFSSVTGLRLWVRSDKDTYTDTGFTTPAVNDGDNVKGWKTQVSPSTAANLTEATFPFTLKLNQVNGYPSCRGGGGATGGRIGGTYSSPFSLPFHIFAVVKLIAWSTVNDDVIGTNTGDSSWFMQGVTPNMTMYQGSGQGAYNTDLAVGTWGIVQLRWSTAANGTTCKVNANAATTTNAAVAGDRAGLKLCSDAFGVAANAEFAEIVQYSADVSASDATSIRNALNSKYAIF